MNDKYKGKFVVWQKIVYPTLHDATPEQAAVQGKEFWTIIRVSRTHKAALIYAEGFARRKNDAKVKVLPGGEIP